MSEPTQEEVEAVARTLYECWPEIDSGEAVDGFQVTPAGPLPWSAIVEMNNDEPYRVAARAAIAAMASRWRPIEEAPRDGTEVLSPTPPKSDSMTPVEIIANAISVSFHEEGYIEGVSDPSLWEEFLKAARLCFTELESAGYAVVPKEPTEEMNEAGIDQLYRNSDMPDEELERVWAVMLAASPPVR